MEIFNSDGIGGSLLAYQAAKVAKEYYYRKDLYPLADHVRVSNFNRPEINEALMYLVNHGDLSESDYYPETPAADLISTARLMKKMNKKICCFWPDLLYNPKDISFDCEKYETSPREIFTTKLFKSLHNPSKKIFIGLDTTTPNYLWPQKQQLIVEIAKSLTDYEICVPKVEKWDNILIDNSDLNYSYPNNVNIFNSPNFIEGFKVLQTCCYAVVTDNGISHAAYNLGMPRLMIDPQYNKAPWIARFREDYNESIPFDCQPKEIAKIVRINLTNIATQLLPRTFIRAQDEDFDWNRALFIK